jgi:hypothetical protein
VSIFRSVAASFGSTNQEFQMRSSSPLLDAGSLFPALRLQTISGTELALPEGLQQPWSVVLFNRGHW